MGLLASPYWINAPVSQLYAPGETVKLDCQADGIPSPTITWTVNGVPVSGERLLQLRRTRSSLVLIDNLIVLLCLFSATATEPRHSLTASGSLILKDVSFGDTAIYQCQASNKHGTILTNTNVYVIGEYLFPNCCLFNRKCSVASYFSFLLRFRTASSDPHWGWKYIHLCWRAEGCVGVWNLWLP